MTRETEQVWPEGHWDWPSVKRGNSIFVGGQVAMDEDGKILYPGDVARQIEIAMENVKRANARASPSADVSKYTVQRPRHLA